MLGLMRRHSRSIIIKLVYVGLILSFLVWGIGSYNSRKDFVAVTVNGESILMNEFQSAFERLVNSYRESLKDNFNEEMIASMNLKKVALDSLISRILMIKEADRLNLNVSKEEIRASIQSYPAFQKDGAFDKETYLNVLNYNKMKPGDFEKDQKKQILIYKVQEAIKANAQVTDDEVLAAYKEVRTSVNLEFLKVESAKFEKKVKPTLAEMKEYFSANVGSFLIPEKIKIGYAIFDPRDYVKNIKLTREEFEDYYNSYIDDFTEEDKVRASHILVKYKDDKEKARASATDILGKVKSGEDFAKLASRYSDDAGSSKKGGDLGFFGRGVMVEEFDKAAFTMEKGEISDLVESAYGFHIIKITGFTEGRTKPLEEVKGEIRKVLEAEISRTMAENSADDIYYEALKGRKLEELAKEEKIPYKETSLFTIENVPDELSGISDLLQTATAEGTGWVSRPRELDGKTYIMTLLDKKEPMEPAFEEVKDDVKKVVLKNKAKEEALQLSKDLMGQAAKGKSFKDLARGSFATSGETGFFSRTSNVVPEIGVSQEIAMESFRLTDEAPLSEKTYRVGEDIFIVRLKEKKGADMALYEKEKEMFRSKLLEQRRDEVFSRWLEDTRRKASISYHEDLTDLQG